jgi:hypothetical protein
MSRGEVDVTVDGVYAGHTPLRHYIAPGEHRVTLFDTKTFRRASFEVRVTTGRSTPIAFPEDLAR